MYLCSATAFIVAYIVHTIPLMNSHVHNYGDDMILYALYLQ